VIEPRTLTPRRPGWPKKTGETGKFYGVPRYCKGDDSLRYDVKTIVGGRTNQMAASFVKGVWRDQFWDDIDMEIEYEVFCK
jgi:hypothetical protein